MQACAYEGTTLAFLESWRWPDGPVCPHCQNASDKRISRLEAQSTSNNGVRKGIYFCGACRQQFTVTVGTVLERSDVPISKWLWVGPGEGHCFSHAEEPGRGECVSQEAVVNTDEHPGYKNPLKHVEGMARPA